MHNSQMLDVRKFRKAIYSRLGNMTRQVILGVNLELKIPLFLKRPGLRIPKVLEMLSIRGNRSLIARRTQANEDKLPKNGLKHGKNDDFAEFSQIGRL